jgi:two-component system, NarL family, response regulator
MSGHNPNKVIRVIVIDDHPVVREGLVAMIARQPDMSVVAQGENGQEAIALFKEHRPDVSLIDLRMPGISGIAAILAIREEFPQSRIIVLTTYDGDEDIYRALKAGVKAYLLKDVFREELLGAIRAVHAGRRHIPVAVATRLAERVASPDLTSREIEVLKLIAKGSSNKEIAHQLAITEGTVKGHVNNILSKMGVDDRTEAAMSALRRGIIYLS